MPTSTRTCFSKQWSLWLSHNRIDLRKEDEWYRASIYQQDGTPLYSCTGDLPKDAITKLCKNVGLVPPWIAKHLTIEDAK